MSQTYWKIEREVHCGDSRRAIRVSNGIVEVIAASDFGPRILSFSRVGGANIFGLVPRAEQAVPTPIGDWHIYGGHRLWVAPEDPVDSYSPDNAEVLTDIHDGGPNLQLVLTQVSDPYTGLEKQISISVPSARSSPGAQLTIRHRVRNCSAGTKRIAAWALTVMRQSGCAIIPSAEFKPHPEALAPARPLVLWPFTRMNDRRWTWGDRLLRLRQDPGASEATKIGLYNAEGWCAYGQGPDLFVKLYEPMAGDHADFGCNTEVFTNPRILELETLSPLVSLAPGETVEHVERWILQPLQANLAEAPEEAILQLIRQTLHGSREMPHAGNVE